MVENKNESFFVEKILFKHKFGSEVKYLIKWEGYPIDKSTWESESNLAHLQPLLNKFEESKIPLKDYAENNCFTKVAINPTNPPNQNKRLKKNKLKTFSKIQEEIQKNQEINKIYPSKKKIFATKIDEKKLKNVNIYGGNKASLPEIINTIISPLITSSNDCHMFPADINFDIPSKVITMKLIDKLVCCLVEWEVRTDGITPDSSFLPAEFLKENFPLPLIEYYESNIRFIEKSN